MPTRDVDAAAPNTHAPYIFASHSPRNPPPGPVSPSSGPSESQRGFSARSGVGTECVMIGPTAPGGAPSPGASSWPSLPSIASGGTGATSGVGGLRTSYGD